MAATDSMQPYQDPQDLSRYPKTPGKRQVLFRNGIVSMAFVGDNVTAQEIDNYESKTERPLLVALKFIALRNSSTPMSFPTQDVNALKAHIQRDGHSMTLFVKIEPSINNPDGTKTEIPLANIISGMYDADFRSFAAAAKVCGLPLLLTAGHEMNGNWYPWGMQPELYKQAYRHIVQVFESEGADNITWVWNPNVGNDNFNKYYPGNDTVDLVMFDGYNSTLWGPWKSVDDVFASSIYKAKRYPKHWGIGESGCDERTANEIANDKPRWYIQKIETCIQKGAFGDADFNEPKFELDASTGQYVWMNWGIFNQPTVTAVRTALANADIYIADGLTVRDKITADNFPVTMTRKPDRSVIVGVPYTDPGQKYVLEYSPNLKSWTGAATNYGNGYPITLTNTPAASVNARYYRVKVAPFTTEVFDETTILASGTYNGAVDLPLTPGAIKIQAPGRTTDPGYSMKLNYPISGTFEFDYSGIINAANKTLMVLFIKSGTTDTVLGTQTITPASTNRHFIFQIPSTGAWTNLNKLNFQLNGPVTNAAVTIKDPVVIK